MSKVRTEVYFENMTYFKLCELTQKWGKKNESRTVNHIVKSWLRQYEEKVRQQLKEKEARYEN